jgi:uncharacterized membrane protein (TIGR02234 family)
MRRTFWPTVLVGVATAALAAMAGHKPWFSFGDAVFTTPEGVNRPEVEGLALVALAAWGVVLVTRGRVRRGVALLAALAGIAAFAFAVHGLTGEPNVDLAGWFTYDGGALPTPHRTAWGWIAATAALLTTVAALAAARLAPGWPEMGRRYDAPTGPAPVVPLEERSTIDVWKALDQGQDPTADQARDRPE